MLQFIIRDATDFDGLLTRFLAELDHRGFDAGRYRLRREDMWGDWRGLSSVDPDDSERVRRQKAGSVSEG